MAVYTEVSDTELARFLAAYDVGTLLSYKGIAEGVENTNYLVQTSHAAYILTLYERRVDPDDLPFFLGLMGHLAERGINCPLPVQDRTGTTLNVLGGRLAALITFLDGVWPRHPTAAQCAALGDAMARMHRAAQDFPMRRPNALGLSGWRPLYDSIATRTSEIDAGLGDLITAELAHLEAHWPSGLPQGVIHADLFPDNVFFVGDRLSGLIDFYFACNDMLAYDIAVCLNAWCFEADFQFSPDKSAALLRGYQAVRPLTGAEGAALPVLARGAAMRFLLTRSYDWLNTPKTALVARKDPLDYVHRLRFHQQAVTLADYGGEVAL